MGGRIINGKAVNIFIWCAFGAAVLSGLVTLIASLTGALGFTLWNLLDAALMWGMAFGLARRSRTCAIIIFVYSLASRADMWIRTKDIALTLGPAAIIFISIYALGIAGTFVYHSRKKQTQA